MAVLQVSSSSHALLQLQLLATNAAKSSNPASSTSSKPPTTPQSISIMATTCSIPSAVLFSKPESHANVLTCPPHITGTTISLLLSVSQAICPGNSYVSHADGLLLSSCDAAYTAPESNGLTGYFPLEGAENKL